MVHDPQHWTLDKRIPIAIIIAIAAQTAGGGYWLGQLSLRVTKNEQALDRKLNDGDRLTRLEVKMDNINDSIQRLEKSLVGR